MHALRGSLTAQRVIVFSAKRHGTVARARISFPVHPGNDNLNIEKRKRTKEDPVALGGGPARTLAPAHQPRAHALTVTEHTSFVPLLPRVGSTRSRGREHGGWKWNTRFALRD